MPPRAGGAPELSRPSSSRVDFCMRSRGRSDSKDQTTRANRCTLHLSSSQLQIYSARQLKFCAQMARPDWGRAGNCTGSGQWTRLRYPETRGAVFWCCSGSVSAHRDMITSPIYGVYWFPTQQLTDGSVGGHQQQQQHRSSSCGTSISGVRQHQQRRASVLLGVGDCGKGSSLFGSGGLRGGLLYGGGSRQQCIFAFGQVNGAGAPYVGYWRNSAATVAAIFGANRSVNSAANSRETRPFQHGSIMETRYVCVTHWEYGRLFNCTLLSGNKGDVFSY